MARNIQRIFVSLWRDGSLETCQKLQNLLFPNGILWDKEKDNYRTFDENEALSIIARLSVNYKNKKEENSLELSSFVSSCKFVTDYRTISLNQMSKGELACTLPWREIVCTANFKRDFLKVVDFVHYLRAEGYDMVTFKKVCDDL